MSVFLFVWRLQQIHQVYIRQKIRFFLYFKSLEDIKINSNYVNIAKVKFILSFIALYSGKFGLLKMLLEWESDIVRITM